MVVCLFIHWFKSLAARRVLSWPSAEWSEEVVKANGEERHLYVLVFIGAEVVLKGSRSKQTAI